jgi:hypothetical protein
VAERLIAPVLKTGRPKGLVSSNLTPSAPASRSCASQDDGPICRGVAEPDVKPVLVGERLYLAGRDIRPVYKSSPLPGIQRDVRGNHIKGVGEI